MLNPNVFLNPKLFDGNIEKVSLREGFSKGIIQAGEEDKRIIALCADLTKSLNLEAFKEKFPERFIEVGVAEQNLVTLASGLAAMGKIPFACSLAIFSPGRNWEQIRTTICLNNQPVKIVGSHAGLTTGPDGATHQALEDIALMRVLPNMVVVSPVDVVQACNATLAIAKLNKPCYLRLPRNEVPVITGKMTPFKIGRADVLWEGGDITILATGQMVYYALQAARILDLDNISARVINVHTIKPLDNKTILSAAKETKAIITIEDHQVIGGLGSAVAELICQNCPVPMKNMGVQDRFGQSGEADELLEKYGLSVREIMKAAFSLLKMKRN